MSGDCGSDVAVMYHRDCADGIGGAWAAYKRYPEATFYPVAHGSEVPEFGNLKRLYIIDFSFSRDVIRALHTLYGSDNVVVLDHHVTARDELAGIPNCIFDMGRSGARIAWEYFFPDEDVPMMLRYIEDRDLWNWDLPYSREVNAYIGALIEEGFESLDDLEADIRAKFESVLNGGWLILMASRMLVDRACDSAHSVTLGGHDVPGVNSAVLQSEIGERLLELYPEAPFAVIYCRDKGQRRWELRARRGGFDVSVIAKAFGGGGHAAAAGFTLDYSVVI